MSGLSARLALAATLAAVSSGFAVVSGSKQERQPKPAKRKPHVQRQGLVRNTEEMRRHNEAIERKRQQKLATKKVMRGK